MTPGAATGRTGCVYGAGGLERCVPLYEAKMIHHFDHRWATYPAGSAGDDDALDVSLAEKRDPAFEPGPRYWCRKTR
jgi:hypothetical protein